MDFIQLTCPNCHASLDAEDSLDTIYCKYCGTKLILHGQDPEVVNAKLQLKLADKELEREKEAQKQRDKGTANVVKYTMFLVTVYFIYMLISHFMAV
jgi:DNA-directed RNA polymerase subunit RPC12/RpoP